MEEFLDHIPLTEEEALGLFVKGDYPAVFQKVEVKTSKTGNRRFVADIELQNHSNGTTRIVTTWFNLPYLLKHAYEAAGMSDKYQSDKLSTKDLEGKKVIARVKVKEGNDQYPQPKNEIYDFVVTPGLDKTPVQNTPEFDDLIPF